MRIITHGADVLPGAAAAALQSLLRRIVDARGHATIAFSGGHSPADFLDALALLPIPWARVHVLQTDERIAPEGSVDRNLTLLTDHLLRPAGISEANVHAIPVTLATPEAAAEAYAGTLDRLCHGTIDVVHLGLGGDGHTASLFPGDAAVEARDRDVVATASHDGWRRVTLTRPAIDRARNRWWYIAGEGKRTMLARLLAADTSIPAGLIRRDATDVLTDVTPAS